MVKQRHWHSLTAQERQKETEQHAAFLRFCCDDGGVVTLHGRTPFRHQVHCAARLIAKRRTTPWAQRKAALLAAHDTGTGKTLTSILAAAAVAKLRSEEGSTAPQLFVVNKSILHQWTHAFASWTDAERWTVAVAGNQRELTSAAFASADVVLTTPETLVAAWKRFMEKVPGARAGTFASWSRKLPTSGSEAPPVHPLFEFMRDAFAAKRPAFSLVVVDEIHRLCSPKSIFGMLIGHVSLASVYTLGLTGTPVRSSVRDLAWIARALNAQPTALQTARNFEVKGSGATSLNEKAIAAFHAHVVDRVDATHVRLPPRRTTRLRFDPFVGRLATGQFDAAQQAKHNALVIAARAKSAQASCAHSATQAITVEAEVWAALTAIEAFAFDATLGMHGAAAFDADEGHYAQSRAQPSEAVKLIKRVVLARQRSGHARVAIFCARVVQLKILRQFLAEDAGECFLFTGEADAPRRAQMVAAFLRAERGVMLLSSAGGEGVHLVPGCEVMLSVGSLPWNSSELDQAFGRVWRIGQEKPVEILQFEPARSLATAKLQLHDDKRERLERAARDEDYRGFGKGDGAKRWRLATSMAASLVELDEFGNYRATADAIAAHRHWVQLCDACDARGHARPRAPAGGVPEVPTLAQNVPLPPGWD